MGFPGFYEMLYGMLGLCKEDQVFRIGERTDLFRIVFCSYKGYKSHAGVYRMLRHILLCFSGSRFHS